MKCYIPKTIKHFLIVVLFFSSQAAFATPPPGYDFTSYTQGVEKAKVNGKPLFIYVGRVGCGFCDLTNKESFSNPDVKKQFAEAFNLIYIDTEGGRRFTLPTGETLTEMQFAESLNLRGTPVFIKASITVKPDNNNNYGKKHYGFKTAEELLQMID